MIIREKSKVIVCMLMIVRTSALSTSLLNKGFQEVLSRRLSMSATTGVPNSVVIAPDGGIKVAPYGDALWSPQGVLRVRNTGAYTCLATVKQASALPMLDFHLNRLVESQALRSPVPVTAELQEDLKHKSLNAMKLALRKWRSVNGDEAGESMVTLLWEYDSTESWVVHCHAWPLPSAPSPPFTLADGVCVHVRGEGRPVPLSKHTSWIEQRQYLETFRGGNTGVAEVILTREGPQGKELLEGLTTNIVIVQVTKDGQCIIRAPTNNSLLGSTQTLCLNACRSLGYAVDMSPLPLREADTWIEAFLTGTTRFLTPITTIEVPLDDTSGTPDWLQKLRTVRPGWAPVGPNSIHKSADADTKDSNRSVTTVASTEINKEQGVHFELLDSCKPGSISAQISAEMRRLQEMDAVSVEDLKGC